MYIVTEPLGPFVVYFFSAFHKNIVKIKRDRLVIRRLFIIHIQNQFSNNGISKTEGQRMSQVSANQKIYNSIQRKYIEWAQNLMKERHRDINTQSQNLKSAVFGNI